MNDKKTRTKLYYLFMEPRRQFALRPDIVMQEESVQ